MRDNKSVQISVQQSFTKLWKVFSAKFRASLHVKILYHLKVLVHKSLFPIGLAYASHWEIASAVSANSLNYVELVYVSYAFMHSS